MARKIAHDYDDKRAAILKTAAQIIANEGYGRASMSQIAQACGISKANIYHYYESKEALLFDILERHLSHLRDRILNIEVQHDDAEKHLETIIRELLLAYQGADAEHEVQLNAINAVPADQLEILKDYQRDLVKTVSQQIAVIAGDSIATDKATLRRLTMSLFAMVNWHYKWDGKANAEARIAYAATITRLIVGGIREIRQNITKL